MAVLHGDPSENAWVELIEGEEKAGHMTGARRDPMNVSNRDDDLFAVLGAPLDPGLVERRRVGGRSDMVPYLEGFQAINQANRIFGFEGWSSHILDFTAQATKAVNKTTGEVTETVLLYRATIAVTALGVSKQDVGVGVPVGASGDAHDMAVKAAVTDGLKRALRQFGPQFGNDLYDRDAALVAQQPVRVATAEDLIPPSVRQRMAVEREPLRPPRVQPSDEDLNQLNLHRMRLDWPPDRFVGWVKSRSEGNGPRDLTPEQMVDALNALANIPTPNTRAPHNRDERSV